jgi:uncharacterized protein (TIGR02453 family)
MIHPNTLKFLKDLNQNNNKPWFDDNKAAYEFAKNDFLEFVKEIITGIEKFDKSFQMSNLDAKKCINRIFRDVRFSKDKTPYKTTMFAMINIEGRKSQKASYYLQIQPGNSFAGGGAYMPMAPELKKFRDEIDYNFKEWEGIVKNENFLKFYQRGVQSYESLIRSPKDYDPDSQAIEYLKMKGFHATSELTDQTLTFEKAINTILVNFKIINPMLDFLNRGL